MLDSVVALSQQRCCTLHTMAEEMFAVEIVIDIANRQTDYGVASRSETASQPSFLGSASDIGYQDLVESDEAKQSLNFFLEDP